MSNTINFKNLGQTTVVGGATPSTVYMNNGDDLFISGANDTVVCDHGNNTVFAASSSVLAYGLGPLSFYNGSGISTVVGQGALNVYGGTGAVAAYGGFNLNVLNGGTNGGNTLVGGTGNSVLRGYGSNNVLVAASGNATLTTYNLNSNELIFCGGGSDSVNTSDGTNTVVGGTGPVTAAIGANTTFFVESGAAAIHGGFGLQPGATGLQDIIVGFRPGTDTLFDGNRQLNVSFSAGGFYSTTLSDGVQLYVFAH